MYILDTHIVVISGQGSESIHSLVLQLAHIRQGVISTLFATKDSFSVLLGSRKMSRKYWFVDTACPCD